MRIAYKFDKRWQTGKYSGKWESESNRVTRPEAEVSEAASSVHLVNFNRARHPLQLSLASYGMDEKWCLVVEVDQPSNSDGSWCSQNAPEKVAIHWIQLSQNVVSNPGGRGKESDLSFFPTQIGSYTHIGKNCVVEEFKIDTIHKSGPTRTLARIASSRNLK